MLALRTILVFVFCFLHHPTEGERDIQPGDQNKTHIEFFPPRPPAVGQTRMPRTLLKKLHSKAAFLAGLKLGTILSKKGFDLGHGKIASTHSFQIFGKSVNSAMSLSYGTPNGLLPIVDDIPEGYGALKTTVSQQEDEEPNVFQVTVIDTPDKASEAKEQVGEKKKNEEVILLYQDVAARETEKPVGTSDFLEEHNKRVKEFNESVLRRTNSKFQ